MSDYTSSPQDSSSSESAPHSQNSFQGSANAHGTSSEGFFNSLRNSGFIRTEPRIFGGVLSGISYKWGWDLTLVRLLFVVVTFFFPLTIAVYAAAWALLPDYRDGSIELESMLRQGFRPVHLGIALLALIGLGNSAFYVTLSLGLGIIALFFPLIFIAGVIVAVYLAVGNSSSPKETPMTPPAPSFSPRQSFADTPHQDGEPMMNSSWNANATRPGTQSTPQGSAPFADTSNPFASPSASSVSTPGGDWKPSSRKYDPLPMWVNLLFTGLIVLLMALTSYLVLHPQFIGLSHFFAPLILMIGGGICLLVVALPLLYAAVKGRSAHWLTFLSIFGLVLAVPVTGLGTHYALSGDYYPSRFVYNDMSEWDHSDVDIHYVSGEQVLDLTKVPERDATEHNIDTVVGDLTILVRKDQPIEVNIDWNVGSVDVRTIDPNADWGQSRVGISGDIRIRSVKDPRAKITTVDIDEVIGSVTVVEVGPGDKDPALIPPASPSSEPIPAPPASTIPIPVPNPSEQPQSASTR